MKESIASGHKICFKGQLKWIIDIEQFSRARVFLNAAKIYKMKDFLGISEY